MRLFGVIQLVEKVKNPSEESMIIYTFIQNQKSIFLMKTEQKYRENLILI